MEQSLGPARVGMTLLHTFAIQLTSITHLLGPGAVGTLGQGRPPPADFGRNMNKTFPSYYLLFMFCFKNFQTFRRPQGRGVAVKPIVPLFTASKNHQKNYIFFQLSTRLSIISTPHKIHKKISQVFTNKFSLNVVSNLRRVS